jgi:predicted ATPase
MRRRMLRAGTRIGRNRSHPAAPVPLTSFVGRERELAAVVDLLSQPGIRLVTLTGPGGAGKTRLALRVADVVAAQFPDGVWFVPFAPIRDGSLVLAVIAQVLGLKVASDRPVVDSLRDYLEQRTALLLDNLEHLLDAVWVIPALLGGSPSLTVLATSRAVLRVSGEHDYPVPALTLPTAVDDVQTEAVRLFVDRARAAKPDFRLDRSNSAAVAEICRRLDGLPLAIEPAATRVRALPPAALAARLDRRLPLLRDGARGLPDRQRTMTNAIAWSYDLLTPEQQGLFRRISAFVGGFGLSAAVAVAGDGRSDEFEVIDGLSVLLDQSLLQEVEPAAPEVDPEPRYRMLETVREYGLEQLALSGEEITIRAAHARFFHDWAEAREPRLHEHDQLAWWRRFEEDHPNFRAALEWSTATDRSSSRTGSRGRSCGSGSAAVTCRNHSSGTGEAWSSKTKNRCPRGVWH